jgi:hypothetical protein
MSPMRIETHSTPIELDVSGAFGPETGLTRADFLTAAAGFDGIRTKFVEQLTNTRASTTSPAGLLEEYKTNRRHGLLGRILATAKTLRDATDRVVLLASPKATMQAQALFAACCHPFHNDLSRGHRGGRPRVYFAPAKGDNDLLQGLFDALNTAPADDRFFANVEDGWALIAADDGSSSDLVAGLTESFLDVLDGWLAETGAKPIAVVCEKTSPLIEVSQRRELPQVIATETSHCQPGVLLACSVMGMDIVKLLRGAAFAATRFASSPPGDNPAFDLAVLYYLASNRRDEYSWAVEAYVNSLEMLAHFLSEPHHTVQSSAMLIQFISDSVYFDRLAIPRGAASKRSIEYLSELAYQEVRTAAKACQDQGVPVVGLRMKTLDEYAVGEVIQTVALAKQMSAHLQSIAVS